MCRNMDDVRIYLKNHGKEIGGRAEKGDVLSAQIVSAYDLLVHRPSDPGPQGLLVGMIHDYQKRAISERCTVIWQDRRTSTAQCEVGKEKS